jgi:hypothetical protein
MVLVAISLRLFVGCGLASALGASGQLPTPFAAFLAGLASPLIIARLFQTISVADPQSTPSSPGTASPASPSNVGATNSVTTDRRFIFAAGDSGGPDATS